MCHRNQAAFDLYQAPEEFVCWFNLGEAAYQGSSLLALLLGIKHSAFKAIHIVRFLGVLKQR